MRTVIKMFLLLTITFMLSAASNIYSQNIPGGRRMSFEDRAKNMISELKDRLTLSKDQVKKVTDIVTKDYEQMKKERDNSSGNFQAMREIMQKHTQKMNESIEKILTKKQKEEFKTYLEERKNRRQMRPNQ